MLVLFGIRFIVVFCSITVAILVLFFVLYAVIYWININQRLCQSFDTTSLFLEKYSFKTMLFFSIHYCCKQLQITKILSFDLYTQKFVHLFLLYCLSNKVMFL